MLLTNNSINTTLNLLFQVSESPVVFETIPLLDKGQRWVFKQQRNESRFTLLNKNKQIDGRRQSYARKTVTASRWKDNQTKCWVISKSISRKKYKSDVFAIKTRMRWFIMTVFIGCTVPCKTTIIMSYWAPINPRNRRAHTHIDFRQLKNISERGECEHGCVYGGIYSI